MHSYILYHNGMQKTESGSRIESPAASSTVKDFLKSTMSSRLNAMRSVEFQ
jgi:hypothetical protein